MAELLKGAPVAEALKRETAETVRALKEAGCPPTLALLRVGERPDDLAYERGVRRVAEETGVTLRPTVLPEEVPQETFLRTLESLNADPGVHGILLFRPLPKQLDGELARRLILPEKDVDGCTDGSLAGVFTGSGEGFTPCTAEAALRILKAYGIALAGKRAAVIGRSLVVGKPAAMLLMAENATVTVCHSRTPDVARVTREADIVISAAGRLGSLTGAHVAPGQTVIDVSVNWDPEKPNSRGGLGALAGDARWAEVEPVVSAITPVPGGVGAVTTAVLLHHVALAAKRAFTKAGDVL